MRQTLNLFRIGMRQITRDGMLFVLLPAPFLVGMVLKFALPVAGRVLEDTLSFSLSPWYALVDGLLACLTPAFVAMISAFLLLEERDEGISAFYQISPAQGYPYLAARMALPMIWALVSTIAALILFNLSALPMGLILAAALVGALTGLAIAMMVVSIAGNRVEGLALSKLKGVSFLGLVFIWFVPEPAAWLSAWLPSFWIGKLMRDGADPFNIIPGLAVSLIWIAIFTRKFSNRIQY
jgi:fluoroquinolone transport system permease protein